MGCLIRSRFRVFAGQHKKKKKSLPVGLTFSLEMPSSALLDPHEHQLKKFKNKSQNHKPQVVTFTQGPTETI